MKENLDAHEAELRGKLIKRLAVAGVMVGVLLAALAFFDYLATPDEPETPVYSRPVPVPPKKELSQPVKPAELPEPPGKEPVVEAKDEKTDAQKAEKTVKEAETPPKPEVAATPAQPVPSAPGKTAQRPAAASKPPVSAVSGRVVTAAPAPVPSVSTKISPSETSIRPLPAAPVKVSQPEATAAPVTKIPEEAVVPAKSAAVPSIPPRTVQPLVAPSPTLPRLLSGYVVQAGVFANAKAAEEMHAKLAMNGIPSTLEARVSVGPFKTREEALAAQEKMKALGIDPVLIPPRRR